jgi:hypothetical protein
MGNYWMARADSPFAEWEAIFSPPATENDIQCLLRFAKSLLEIGEHESIYRVLETRSPINFMATSGQNYAQFLEGELAENGTLLLFDLGLGVAENYEGTLRTPAHICYYNLEGDLTESEVENMGALLENLRPDDADWGNMFMGAVSPITVLSRQVSLRELSDFNQQKRAVQIRVLLYTDIWFPKVLGILEGDQSLSPDPPKWYTNSELANCHTPRLNRFVSKVHQLTLELNGEWRLNSPEGLAEHYKSMLNKDGIIL